jgi:hypothetical protein
MSAAGTDVALIADDLEKLAYALKLAKCNRHMCHCGHYGQCPRWNRG